MTAPITGVGSNSNADIISSAQQQAAVPGGQMGKNEFLQLLVTQMKNQDPENPMDGTQMATQLAQFSSVEQLLNIATAMDTQTQTENTIVSSINANAAMGAIGHSVLASGSDVAISGKGNDSVTIDVSGAGGTGKLQVYNASGDLVGSRSLGSLGGGRQTISLGSAENGLAAGSYTYKVSVTDSSGTDVPVNTYTVGTIDGVRYTASGPVLTAGALMIPYSNVVEIAK